MGRKHSTGWLHRELSMILVTMSSPEVLELETWICTSIIYQKLQITMLLSLTISIIQDLISAIQDLMYCSILQ